MKFFNVILWQIHLTYVIDTGLSSSAIEYTKSKVVENIKSFKFLYLQNFLMFIHSLYVFLFYKFYYFGMSMTLKRQKKNYFSHIFSFV